MLLLLLVSVGFAIQYVLDRTQIAQRVGALRGSELHVLWTPWVGWLGSTRWHRSYRISYRDENGRVQQRPCVVHGFLGGADSILLGEPRSSAASPRFEAARTPRFLLIVLCAGAGTFAGAALGIGGSFLIYPGSNIAPAYGLLLVAPLGFLGGVLVGALRGR